MTRAICRPCRRHTGRHARHRCMGAVWTRDGVSGCQCAACVRLGLEIASAMPPLVPTVAAGSTCRRFA